MYNEMLIVRSTVQLLCRDKILAVFTGFDFFERAKVSCYCFADDGLSFV